jgi:DNA-binding winged helix-turn-helix (wHTH) protein/TolB-like protein/tetratricopeptide (TPR) repeat protein
MLEQKQQIYAFDNFRLDVRNRELLRDGTPVTLPAKAFDMLVVLIESGGRLIEKDELFSRIWPDQIVEESNLTVQVSAIRKALGERRENPHYIATVPGHGYRFIGELISVEDEAEETLIERRSISRVTIESDGKSSAGAEVVVRDRTRETLTVEETTITGPRGLRVAILIGGSLLGVALVIGVGFLLFRKSTQPLPVSASAPIKSIAVLPFKPLAADSRDESLELGMTETLITRLSGVREITVRPTSAVRKYGALDQDALAAGRELQVESVLDGSLQRAGDRIRVTVRFVRVADGQTLWVERFDENFTDIFALQDRVSARVVGLLAVRLMGSEQTRLTKRFTENPEAYELYLKGRYFFNKFTPADHQMAENYFKQAIAKDPIYARAYVGLADTYASAATNSWTIPNEGYRKAKAAVKKALELDDTLAEAHANSGALAMFYDFDWMTAEREYKRAIELDPNYPLSYELYSYLLSVTGRLDEAITTINRGREADPLSVLLSSDAGQAYYWARRYDEAIKQYRQSIQMDPNDPATYLGLGIVHEQKGMYDEAVASYEKAISVSRRASYLLGPLGHALANSGRRAEALKILDELKAMSRREYVSPYDLAILYTGLGEKERAIAQLNKAFEERAGWIMDLKVEPFFDPLRSDPRFDELLQRLRLPT